MILRQRSVLGTVTEFDPQVGLGVLSLAHAGGKFPFHCIAIADGSREIAVHTRVEFDVVAGPAGRWEAASIRPQG